MASGFSFRTLAACLFMLISTAFVSFTLAKRSVVNNGNTYDIRSEGFLHLLAAPDTVKAMTADKQLQRNVLDALQITADLTKRLADTFDSIPEVREASENLEQYRIMMARSVTEEADQAVPRQLPNPFASITDGSSSAASGSMMGGMSKALGDVFSNIGSSLLSDVGGAALFLGSGLGAGAAQGLNIAPAAMTKTVAAKVASDNGQQATGLNPAIMNAAMGATASLLGAVNVSSLTSSAGGLISNIDIRGAALGLAEGLGNGTASGLQLSTKAATLQAPPGNTTADIAGTFGFGLTKSVTGNLNTSGFSMSSLTNTLQSVNISQFTGGQPVSQIALVLAQNVGNGASSGLGLTQANLQPPAGNSASDALGAFGFGLVNSVTSNINTTALLSQAKNTNVNSLLGNVSLGQTGQSFGTGLGSGLAAGLKLSSAIVDAPNPNAGDVPSVAGNFAFGLTKGLAENINGTMLLSKATSGGGLSSLTGSVDFGRVAQGGAMGLVQGAGDAINSMGGLQALINGTAMMPSGPLVMSPMVFNDSIGGAATGLGMGLGGQGTLVGVQLLSQLNVTSLIQQITGQSTSGGSTAMMTMPPSSSSSNATAKMKRDYLLPAEVVRRQAQVGAISTNNSFNLSLLINADTVSDLGQRFIDAVGCEGIGGLALLALGLSERGTVSLNSVSSFNLTLVKQAIPKGVMRFQNNGNLYTIDGTVVANNIDSNLLGAAGGITVNGNPLIAFVVFLIVHIIVALLVLVLLLPLALSLDATRNILVRLGLKDVYPAIPQWVNIIWVFLIGPLAITALVFGGLTGGSSGHLRTAHGILGLLTILASLGGVVLHLVARYTSRGDLQNGVVFPRPFKLLSALTLRTVINQATLMLTLPTVIAGFSDLASVALCLTRIVPFEAGIGFAAGLTFLYTVASFLSSLVMYLASKDIRNAKKGKPAVRLDVEANRSFKEKIQVIREEGDRI